MSSPLARFALIGLAGAQLAGCHKLTSVKVAPANAELEAVSATESFHAEQLDADGKPMSKQESVAWTSDHPEVATVGADGTATAVKSGHATLTATAGKVSGTARVNVHIPGKITGQDVTIGGLGQSQSVAFGVQDDSGEALSGKVAALKVVVADPKVASVQGPASGSWTFTATAPGSTQVVVTLGALTQSFNLTVSLPEVTDLTVTPKDLKLKVGESMKLTPTAKAGAVPATSQPITFTSSNAKVATVDPDGTVHIVGKGKATVTVTAGAKSVQVPVQNR